MSRSQLDGVRSGRLRGPAARSARNGAWSVVEAAVPMAANAIFLAVLARVVPVTDFGVYAYATTLANFGLTIVTAGLNGLAVRELVNRPDDRGQILSNLVLIRVTFGAAAFAAVLAVALASTDRTHVVATAIAATALFGRAVSAPTFWYQAVTRTRVVASIRGWVSLTLLALRVVVAFTVPSVWAFVALFAFEAAVSGAAVVVAYLRDPGAPRPARPSWTGSRHLVRLSWPLIASSAADQVNSRADVLVIQSTLGSAQLGLYAAATRLGEFAYFLPRAYAAGTFPRLLDIRRDHGPDSAEYRRALQAGLDRSFWGGALVALPIAALSTLLMGMFFGPEYRAAGPVLGIYTLSMPFVFMAASASKWILAEGMLWASLWRHASAAALNVVLNLLLIPRYGIVAAAWVSVGTYAYASCFSFLLTRATVRYGLQMLAALVWPARAAWQLAARARARHTSGTTERQHDDP